jgi:hypothetical protein
MPCYRQPMKNGGTMIICGKLGPHCSNCMAVGDYLCDYPVGKGKTCDRPLCESHAHEVAPDIHYCPGHLVMWQEFKDAGGVKAELENVVPFKEQP